ncbi:ribonuclease 2-5A-domain-containing protein [Crucibulum laeve]|uniref:Ribonuclease 2-5A-domain-containing protein n=1 Tax=Crucibulum laeve TaxID=68775 RepID=A0A5C3LEK0_9AGAR|nr:ribonuclease 2-5A-domain-containing protein [Crucibulum laeve]
MLDTPTKPTHATAPSLIVSGIILDFGSYGTVGFQGSPYGCAVAVKRLQDFASPPAMYLSFMENFGKFRNTIPKSVQDPLPTLRNKKHPYQDLPENIKSTLDPMPEGFLAYFTAKYPQLFLHVHGVIGDTSLQYESMFRAYFELPEL